jgi:hypothetical protein|tara:strand:+ start:31 stop:783 length:753 start_codon:yes stop_codon:yes gene_type:complete
MKQGVLLFCFNTPVCEYHRILERCVALIKKNLKLEITVVTNLETFKKIKPLGMINYKLIENDTSNKLLGKPWYQVERHMAYELSPYDKTILMDIDYFCFTDNLLELLKLDDDFLIHDKVYDIVAGEKGFEFTRDSIIPILWATVIVFKKTQYTKRIFDLVNYVKENYQHFCLLYRLSHRNFRNDYAFSIAINQANGYMMPKFLPGRLPMLSRSAKVLQITDNSLVYQYKNKIGVLENQDVHVLNKEVANV